jgi:quinol monooxygenase YgiN
LPQAGPERQAKSDAVLHLIAVISAKPGHRESLLAAFQANVPNVHAEPGCIEYAATVDAAGFDGIQAALGPDTFIVVEKWASPEALRAHMTAPHMAAYGEQTKDLLASRVLHILSPV